jgi:pimeloyl-ACP methyl ester carboxylesterase
MTDTIPLVTEEFMVKSIDPGIELYVRNKRPAEGLTFTPQQVVLYVHGATYPASTTFDLRLDGSSWMEYIAHRNYDVWLLDLRGYGYSTRPSEMAEKPEANAPIVNGETALKDVGAVVDHILQRRKIPRLNLLGWSWGTTLMATFATQNISKVERLLLYAPAWLFKDALSIRPSGKLGAYRTVTREQVKDRWYAGVPDEAKASLVPPGWFDVCADATFATDPVGSKMTPPVFRAPNGVFDDADKYWASGKPYFDPSKITVPTLILTPEWDHDLPPYMAQTLYSLLVNSPGRKYVDLPEGTHAIIMEKNRLKLFEAVQSFLDEAGQA